MPCCNAAGTHKLSLCSGKSKNSRAFKNTTFAVIYKSISKGWMTRCLFQEWFRKYFIPEMKKFLPEVKRPHKALLIVDNAPSHPPEAELNINQYFKVLLHSDLATTRSTFNSEYQGYLKKTVARSYNFARGSSELKKRLCIINTDDIKNISDSLKIIDTETNFSNEKIFEWEIGEKDYVIDLTEETSVISKGDSTLRSGRQRRKF